MPSEGPVRLTHSIPVSRKAIWAKSPATLPAELLPRLSSMWLFTTQVPE
jgi:hypothetical protein